MYCPNCAVSNNDDTKFCRGCGANLSLVPQALTGQLPADQSKGSHKGDKQKHTPNLGRGIQHAFMGVGFLLVALSLAFFSGGRGWWFWLLIPAFGLLGTGVGEILTARLNQGSGATQAIPPAPRAVEMPPHITGPIVPPPSVTEGTTRHLDATTDPSKR